MGVFVFVHGSPGSGASWAPLVALAPVGSRCEAVDLPDHGAAPDAPTGTLDDMVEDVVRRCRSLDAPVTLVGHSFGAWVAGRALASLGDRAVRFVAICGFASLSADVAARSTGFADALSSGALSLEAAAGAAVDLWLPTVGRREADVTRVRELILADRPERLARVLSRHAGLAAPERRVQRYDTPATILHVTGDRAVSRDLGRDLAALGANARWVELPGDGHFPEWTDTSAVAEIVFGA